MERNVAVAIVCLAVIGMLAGTAQAATVGFWQFNEKDPGQQADGTAGAIQDSSGNGHHGAAVGDPLPSYVAGPSDPPSAIGLTGGSTVQDRIEIPHSADFNLMLGDLQDYTIEAIVKLPAEQPYSPAIVSKRATTGRGWTFRVEPSGAVGLYIEGTGLNFTYPDAQGTISIRDNTWHHVAAVIDANSDPALASVTLYVDHVEDAKVLITDAIYLNYAWVNENIVNTHDVWIGDFIDRNEDQLVGAVDAVRFSTGILTPDEFLDIIPEPSSMVLLLAGVVMGVVMSVARRAARHKG